MTGFNLPPGCNVSDIPGNRPEDERWEAILEGFWNGENCSNDDWEKFEEVSLDSKLVDVVDKAIEYGMEINKKEQQSIDSENKYYETRFIEEAIWNNTPEKAIEKIKSILGIK